MKTYNKTNTFPITHNNEVYSMDIQVSALVKTPGGNYEQAKLKMKELKLKGIIVRVMHPNLRGKTDLHGRPYTPNEWIFTNRKNIE